MPFGKELSHLVEEQIKKSTIAQNAESTGSVSASGSNNSDKIALIEANVQRLAEQMAQIVSSQKKNKYNQIEYGLEAHVLHGMRIAITSGRAIFRRLSEPLDCPFMYLELSPSLSGRQIRYIYLTSEATLIESTTNPSDMEDYIPLALVDVWAGVREITTDKVQDIRPRANGVMGDFKEKDGIESLLTGNVTVFSTDTGKDSFVIRQTEPPSMRVIVSSGRALVDGEMISAEGGELDLSNYFKVANEYVGVGNGAQTKYSLYHQHVDNVKIWVSGIEEEITIDEENGEFFFGRPIEENAEIRASYEFSGSCIAVFFVEKIYTAEGKPLGVIGWAIGSTRRPYEPPQLINLQHVIGKVNLESTIGEIVDVIIDNQYEVVNLTQEELQYGENLGGTSLQDGAITTKKISASAIVGDHIAAGAIDAAKISSGAIESQHISAGSILAKHIAADTITAEMIKGGTISAEKFESSTWGDMTQAIRYVKSVLKGQNFWRKPLMISELASGIGLNVSYDTEKYPTLRLKNIRQWDLESDLENEQISNWDFGAWDGPVKPEGWWESPSIDYGRQEDLQAEFWVKPLLMSSDHVIQVKFRYSDDGLTWSDYEGGIYNQAAGYYYWSGDFQNYRYLKIRVEMKTINPENYEILAYPEVRLASATRTNVGDIRFPAMTVKPGELKLNGALLKRQDYPVLWSWANENFLVVSEEEWNEDRHGYFSSGDTTNTFRLPDTRGEFFRVLDEGRGLDKDRRVGTSQEDAIREIEGEFHMYDRASNWAGTLFTHTGNRSNAATGSGNADNWLGKYNFKASKFVPTAEENRPHNIAYFACIRYS